MTDIDVSRAAVERALDMLRDAGHLYNCAVGYDAPCDCGLHAARELVPALLARAERLEAALRLLHDNVVLAFPTLADLGPVANARAALKGADHE